MILLHDIYLSICLKVKVRDLTTSEAHEKKGCFLYGNHTLPQGDAFVPLKCKPHHRIYTIVNASNLGIPVLGKLLPMLGAIPIPGSLHQMLKFRDAIYKRVKDGGCVVIYPEAHVWPYYTGIRPFEHGAFSYPADTGHPCFCSTVTYQKHPGRKKPAITVWLDGPFYPDMSLKKKQRQAKLEQEISQCMCKRSVDRIFLPHVMHVPPEGQDKNSPYMCAIVMGYATVTNNSQQPEERYGVAFDTPVFHWFNEHDRKSQICKFAQDCLHAGRKEALTAFHFGEKAICAFRKKLRRQGLAAREYAKNNGTFAVVLAGRPYHTDPLVSHEISSRFTEKGIPVLTVDSLPYLNEINLENIRPEITNNFHTRMIEGAVRVAGDPDMEYVQIVSFGCGHDAILSDEITRILSENGKNPLILKVDESDASGALNIRIQSFLETVEMKRNSQKNLHRDYSLSDPYPAKFEKKDVHRRKLIIPNITEDVMVLMKAILEKAGYDVVTVPVGGKEQIQAGKRCAHNDICFPCQMVVGELITALQNMDVGQEDVAVGMIKFQCDCRLSHYAALLRKGMDAAGFSKVPILTTDVRDSKNMHHGVMFIGPQGVWDAVWCFMMLDILQSLVRKIRPYETNAGETDTLFHESIREIAKAIKNGPGDAKKAFQKSIEAFSEIQWDRSNLRSKILVTGELLVTYHPGSNYNMEKYLEECGMEVVFPRITDQLRKDFYGQMRQIRDFKASIPPYPFFVDGIFDYVQKSLENIAVKHPLYERELRPKDIYEGVSDFMPATLSCGEGWLMAAEIDHLARKGV